MAGWDECDRLLAEASSKASPPCTGEDLLFVEEEGEQVQVWPIKLGLGRLEEILSIRPGEICEVYGAPGTGKTLLGLSVSAAACCASRPVLYVTVKDPPWALAERLGSLAAARQIDEAALEHVRIYQAMNFTDFAQILAAPEIFQDKQPLVIIDGLTTLLSPFTSATSWAHRWRFAWAWRSLRHVAMPRGATARGACVLILSHTAGQAISSSVCQVQTQCASRRLELKPGCLEVKMAKRGLPNAHGQQQVPSSVDFVLCDAGVLCR
ncbi:unnamed protein product [Durusdinium trenchii]|uniref:Uncharacterized protein n=1 Tax=Durusdinium trenchii TaxID=1381693 RepID=A0ABP0NSV5_9DINO